MSIFIFMDAQHRILPSGEVARGCVVDCSNGSMVEFQVYHLHISVSRVFPPIPFSPYFLLLTRIPLLACRGLSRTEPTARRLSFFPS